VGWVWLIQTIRLLTELKRVRLRGIRVPQIHPIVSGQLLGEEVSHLQFPIRLIDSENRDGDHGGKSFDLRQAVCKPTVFP
jgi:hypothetical protein